LGLPALSPVITSNKPTNGEITVGLAELRVDSALNGARPFGGRSGVRTASSAVTVAADFILAF
jgi:hypothetical protein